jgi:hypothetical protein
MERAENDFIPCNMALAFDPRRRVRLKAQKSRYAEVV